MEKRTTIYLDADDVRAIEAIRADHERRGLRITASAAIRSALRAEADRIAQQQRRKAAQEARR